MEFINTFPEITIPSQTWNLQKLSLEADQFECLQYLH